MITVRLCDAERIQITDGCFETERRYTDGYDYQWQVIECHGSLAAALSAAAQRKICSTPNDDLSEFIRAAEGITAAYQQIFNRALEFGHGPIHRRQVA